MSKENYHMYLKFNFNKIIFCFLQIIIFSLSLVNESLAQQYSLYEIKEIFLQERPQTGEQALREDCFISIDNLILGTYPPLHPDIEPFFGCMLEKAILEIKNENVIEGATIWQIYNHGFIVKTPSITIGFDLDITSSVANYEKQQKFLELADLLDIYLISHSHPDHYFQELIDKMTNLNKPVLGPAEMSEIPIKMNAGDSQLINGLNIIAHDGVHSVPVRQFEVTTEEGLKFLHTGDNTFVYTLPLVTDLDILMVNCWIDDGIPSAIEKLKPQVTLPGHMMELQHFHWDSPPLPYNDPIAAGKDSLASEYFVLGWGERYHFNNSTNDTITPNIVRNLTHEIQDDSIMVSWDIPAIAVDGDSVSFYRIIIDNTEDYFCTKPHFSFYWDTIRTYNFKIYSYDDCGNQCEYYTEIDVSIPNINYPPDIIEYEPMNNDTIQLFSGVYSKVFSVEAADLNNDELSYTWAIDHQNISDADSTSFLFIVSDLDSGFHQLTVTISDQEYSKQISWMIDYHTSFSIVDDEDLLMYSEIGKWYNDSQRRAYGKKSSYCRSTDVGNSAEYKFYPEKAGSYDVYEIIPNTTTAINNVVYNVLMNTQSLDSVYIDQRENRGNWTKIGSYYFPADADVSVKIINTGLSTIGNRMYADAVKFDYIGDDTYVGNNSRPILDQICLMQNHPNPFNPTTTIKYNLQKSSNVILKIYNLGGQEIETLVNKYQKAGEKQVKWTAEKLSSGIYFCRLQAGEFSETKKLILQK